MLLSDMQEGDFTDAGEPHVSHPLPELQDKYAAIEAPSFNPAAGLAQES
jgi:hypothetical protein